MKQKLYCIYNSIPYNKVLDLYERCEQFLMSTPLPGEVGKRGKGELIRRFLSRGKIPPYTPFVFFLPRYVA